MTASGLFNSCATPEIIWPSDREFLGLAQLLLQTQAIGDFAEKELVGALPAKLNRRADDVGRNERAVFMHQVQRALRADEFKPLMARLRRLLRARLDLTKVRQALAGGLVDVDAQEVFGRAVQFQNAQIGPGGNDNRLAGLLKEPLVALLGEPDFALQFFPLKEVPPLVVVAHLLQHQDDHAHGNEQLQDGRDQEAGGGQGRGFKEGIRAQIRSPEEKTDGQQPRAQKGPDPAVTVKGRRCQSGWPGR